jgi:hypothetical protein
METDGNGTMNVPLKTQTGFWLLALAAVNGAASAAEIRSAIYVMKIDGTELRKVV